jgi:threonine/homoserine/homoserine lactone efflux protein
VPDGATFGVFVVASLVLLVTPGPASVYIITRSIEQGWIAGVVSSLGLGVGSLVHVAAAWIGMTVVLFSSDLAFTTLKYAGAAYLVYLGIQAMRAGDEIRLDGRIDREGLKQAFSQAIVVNLLNPKAALFFIAFLPQFVDPSRGNAGGQLLFLCAVFFAMAITTDSIYAILAGRVGDLLRTNPTFRRRQRYFSAAVYVLLGVAAALSGLSGSAPPPSP